MISSESHGIILSYHRTQNLRAVAIEEKCPEVKFFRNDGYIDDFGLEPEQGFGTINGNPFYYRYRNSKATLEVWDSSEVPPEEYFVPNHIFNSILESEILVTEESEFDEDIFILLLRKLSPKNYFQERKIFINKKFGFCNGEDLKKQMKAFGSKFEFLEFESILGEEPKILFQYGSGLYYGKIEWFPNELKQKIWIELFSSKNDFLSDEATLSLDFLIDKKITAEELLDEILKNSSVKKRWSKGLFYLDIFQDDKMISSMIESFVEEIKC